MPKRRGHGEGSIYQRKDGRWCATVTVGRDATGKLKRRYIYGATAKEVQEKKTRLLADQLNGLPVEPSKQNLKQFLETWLEDTAKTSVAPRTYARYESLVRVHIVPALGNIALGKLSAQHLQRFYRQKQEAGEHNIAKKCHVLLHRALGQALRWGLVPRNVADLVDAPRVPHKEMKVLTPEEAQKFLEAAQGDRFYALYALAIACGLRLGELLGLKWEDIDFGAGTLQVRRQLQWVKGGPQFMEPKTKQSRRTIFLPPLAVTALKEHRKKQREERLRLADVWQDNGLVFCTEIGTPINPPNLHRRSFRPILERAGVTRVRFHDLRHTCATLLLMEGTNPRVVQEQLGHSNIATTLGLYSHVLPSMKKQVADTMESILTARHRIRSSKVDSN